MKKIDLRSDAVTKPSQQMREAMFNAEVGDDVLGDDPTVHALESLAATMLGKEAAVFTPTGTQANLMAIMAHCERGDEYIVGQQAHAYKWEGGGAAVLGSVQPQPLDFELDGTLCLKKVREYIKPLNDTHARTKLLCLENTQSGKPLPLHYFTAVKAFCEETKLASHLDGARLFNALVYYNVEPIELTQYIDSVVISLSKGLGAPVGSVLAGSREFIRKARRWRKVLGGGMRQSGILAAAGIYALKHNIKRLEQDHKNAMLLAQGLNQIDTIKVIGCHTNMVFVQLPEIATEPLQEYLFQRNILMFADQQTRLVTHLDVDESDIKLVLQAFNNFFSK